MSKVSALGRALAALMEKENKTQEELAKEIPMSRSSLSKLMSGKQLTDAVGFANIMAWFVRN